MQRNIRLTDRDIALVRDCYRYTLLSFEQLARRHFPGRSVSTISNRLGQLCRAGLLDKTRVNLSLFSGRKEVGVIYQVTRAALRILPLRYPEEPFRDCPVTFNPTTLVHDLTLNDVMAALETRYPTGRWVHGRLFDGAIRKGGRVPDAVFLSPRGSPEIAVELELTAKSERRYREIVLQYQLSPDVSKVLYVVGSRSIADKIKYQITHRKEIPGLPAPATGKFHFAVLGELVGQPVTALMTNGQEALSLINQTKGGNYGSGTTMAHS